MPKILEDNVHQESGRGAESSSSCTKYPSTSRRCPPRLSYPPGKSTCMAPPDGPECYRFSRNSKKLTATACNLKKVVRFNHLRNFTRQQIPVGVRPFSHPKSVKTWVISCSLPRKTSRFVIWRTGLLFWDVILWLRVMWMCLISTRVCHHVQIGVVRGREAEIDVVSRHRHLAAAALPRSNGRNASIKDKSNLNLRSIHWIARSNELIVTGYKSSWSTPLLELVTQLSGNVTFRRIPPCTTLNKTRLVNPIP